jgi:DNA-binding GntR family transcriptional regulator
MNDSAPLAQRILDKIVQDGLQAGHHLSAQALADAFKVSRSPVNKALAWLAEHGLIAHQPNRGYFVASQTSPTAAGAVPAAMPGLSHVQEAYLRLADDCFKGQLPATVSESLLRQRYDLTPAQLKSLLQRIVHEGWISKTPGYGWEFAPMLNSAESLLQSYRLRIAIEPAALLEPSFYLAPAELHRCRQAELHLLNGGIDTDSADQIYESGVHFHETLMQASGNPFFIDALRRVNRIRRLISYRSMVDRKRYPAQIKQHLHLLDLLEKGQQQQAADAMRRHLQLTIDNHLKIQKLLKP